MPPTEKANERRSQSPASRRQPEPPPAVRRRVLERVSLTQATVVFKGGPVELPSASVTTHCTMRLAPLDAETTARLEYYVRREREGLK